MSLKTIYVHECFTAEHPALMGCLHADTLHRKETCSFEYHADWLQHHANHCFLDPDLQLYQGRQYAPIKKSLFGLFSDSCPDRWGRLLMRRMETILANRESRKPRQLTETDYLLGVHDEARMGALRFSLQPNGPFMSSDHDMAAAPPWSSLHELEAASLAFEQDEDLPLMSSLVFRRSDFYQCSSPDKLFATQTGQLLNDRWLRQLLVSGSCLGGARPKVTVKDARDHLWIAKFPSHHDEQDIGAWEQVAHELAKACGLHTPESKLERFSDKGSTFLVKRFDRQNQHRIHFASAMALLGQMDGAGSETGQSYLDIAEFITAYGSNPQEDLEELWKRILFSISISNTDDHLRNHGFQLTHQGWRLSPLYDVNPVPYGEMLALNISLDDARMDPELAIDVAPYFGIKKQAARETAQKLLGTIRRLWRPLSADCGLPHAAQEAMAPAFDVAEHF